MLGKIISEEIAKLISEKIEIAKYDDFGFLCQTIMNDSNKGLTDKMYSLTINNENIAIQVYFRQPYTHGGYFGYGYNGSYEIKLYLENECEISDIKGMLGHELTHILNDLRKNNLTTHKVGYDYYPNSIEENEKITDSVNQILYRLWSRDERTAYLTHSYLGKEYCIAYVNYLNALIDQVEESSIKENYWTFKYLQKMFSARFSDKSRIIRPKIDKYRGKYNYDTNENLVRIKRFFVKKSKHLLELYIKKLKKNDI